MNLNELFSDSERAIKEIQKQADLKKQELHKPVPFCKKVYFLKL